jgi:hypothetical protein
LLRPVVELTWAVDFGGPSGDLPGVDAVSLHPPTKTAAPVNTTLERHFFEITVKRMG